MKLEQFEQLQLNDKFRLNQYPSITFKIDKIEQTGGKTTTIICNTPYMRIFSTEKKWVKQLEKIGD